MKGIRRAPIRWLTFLAKQSPQLHYVIALLTFASIVVGIGLQKLFNTTLSNEGIVANAFASSPLPDHIHISAVIMNHARPHVLQNSQLLPVLCRHSTISEILLLHSNPETAFDNDKLKHISRGIEKIQHIDASKLDAQVGLALRFHYCATHCRNDWVLHIDDDMELDASAVNNLVHHMIINPKRIVGHFGRRYSLWRALHRNGYDTSLLKGSVEVVLTKILVLEREICQQFVLYSPLMDDIVPESKPRWNGEDIFVNLVANHYYNVPLNGPFTNFAIPDLHVWEADISSFSNFVNENSVSGNMDRTSIWTVGLTQWLRAYSKATSHTRYRGRLWYLAKERLVGQQ